MRVFFGLVIMFCFIFLSCSGDKKKQGENNKKKNPLALQREMLNILESNAQDPEKALKELDVYYKKYASLLKQQLKSASTKKGSVSDEYSSKMSKEQKELFLRQQNAINEILKREPNFNAKLMLLMQKHGLTKGY